MSQEMKALLIIGVVTVAILVGGIVFLGGKGASSSQTEVLKADTSLLVRDDSFKTATDSAKVTVVEFADFQCPACGAVFPTVKKIENEYSGRVSFVFRHFPLPQHKNGMPASLAAEAAGEQGKFWEMHDKLFVGQDKWSESGSAVDDFVSYASDLGLDIDKFKAALENKSFTSKIKRDQDDGYALGVNSTPTFFINGEKVTGALGYDEFKKKIDIQLNK